MTGRPARIEERVVPPYDFSTLTWDSLSRDVLAIVEVAKAARTMVDEAGGPMEGQAWLDLRAALSVLDNLEAGEPRD